MVATDSVAQLLLDANGGNQVAVDRLLPIVYEELHRIARRHMRRERPDHSLQTAALVNEAYLRLVQQQTSWQSRAQFLGIAAQLMRRILIDHARAHLYAKRGGGAKRLSLTEADGLIENAEDLVRLNDALLSLAQVEERQVRIVELKFFAGMTIEEIAAMLEVSPRTVEREWRTVRAWLAAELSR
jgi:RNA polymerase sigma factor (TIGR02999 family)